METTSFTALELFNLGGIFMWPLLFFSIATIGISLERAVYLFYHKLDVEILTNRVSVYLESGDFKGAVEYLTPLTERHMGARIFLAMIKRSSSGQTFSEHHVERAAETEAVKCINSLENGFSFLTALGSISPLTGFLGTVSGMIGAFRSIAEATEVNAQIVANGIYEALITTVFGLVIAIIAMIFHSIFRHIVDKFTARVEGSCSELIDCLVQVKLKQAKLKQAQLAKAQLTQTKPGQAKSAQINKTTKKST